MKLLNRKSFPFIFVTFILIVGLVATIILVGRRQEIRKKAEGSTVALSILPQQHNFNTGEILTIQLQATFNNTSSGEKLDGFRTEIVFPKEYFQVADEELAIDTGMSGFDEPLVVSTPQLANENGRIVIELVSSTPSKSPSIEGNKTLTIATIKLKAIKQTPSPLSQDNLTINLDNTEITNNQAIDLNITSASGGRYEVGVELTGSCQTLYTLIQEAMTSQCGDTKYNKKADINKDTFVTIIDFSLFSANYSDLSWCDQKLADETDPCAAITQASTPPPTEPLTPEPSPNPNLIKIGTIFFRAKPEALGNASIDFRTDLESKAVEKDTALDILGQTNGLTFIVGDIGESPVISFKVKFRSVNEDVGEQKVIVRVKKGSLFKEFKDITVRHEQEGFYKAENIALIDVPSGNDYKLYIKGPKHLAKGFDVNLIARTNPLFDLTNTELEPGDTPPQDGVINSLDISRIIELLEVPSPSLEQLFTADLNYDGVINGGDTNELIHTLSKKYDEDRF